MKENKKMKIAALTIVVVIALLLVVFRGSLMKMVNGNNSGKVKIGFLLDTTLGEQRQIDKATFTEKAKQLGADVILQDAGNDSNKQISQIEQMMNQNVDVLVIAPVDGEAIMPAVKKAIKDGIKVISYDKIIRNSNVDLYITFDNQKAGRLMADALTKKVPKGAYIVLNGDENDQNATLVNYGIHDMLDAKVQKGDIRIENEIWVKNWSEKDAYDSVEAITAKDKKIDGIIAASDKLADAAFGSLSKHGLAGRVPLVAQDALLSSCQRIVEGTQLLTIYKPFKKLAQDAADAAVKLASSKLSDTMMTMQDGTYNVPVITEDVTAVDRKNMTEVVIKSGLHLTKDVYQNVPKNKWPNTVE